MVCQLKSGNENLVYDYKWKLYVLRCIFYHDWTVNLSFSKIFAHNICVQFQSWEFLDWECLRQQRHCILASSVMFVHTSTCMLFRVSTSNLYTPRLTLSTLRRRYQESFHLLGDPTLPCTQIDLGPFVR